MRLSPTAAGTNQGMASMPRTGGTMQPPPTNAPAGRPNPANLAHLGTAMPSWMPSWADQHQFPGMNAGLYGSPFVNLWGGGQYESFDPNSRTDIINMIKGSPKPPMPQQPEPPPDWNTMSKMPTSQHPAAVTGLMGMFGGYGGRY